MKCPNCKDKKLVQKAIEVKVRHQCRECAYVYETAPAQLLEMAKRHDKTRIKSGRRKIEIKRLLKRVELLEACLSLEISNKECETLSKECKILSDDLEVLREKEPATGG